MEFNRFDVSTKELVWDDPVAWLQRLGIDPRGPVEVIDSGITTLTASADRVALGQVSRSGVGVPTPATQPTNNGFRHLVGQGLPCRINV